MYFSKILILTKKDKGMNEVITMITIIIAQISSRFYRTSLVLYNLNTSSHMRHTFNILYSMFLYTLDGRQIILASVDLAWNKSYR